MATLEVRSSDKPDETRKFHGHGWAEVVDLGGRTVIKGHFQPGWRWSNDVKPIAQTELCEVSHPGYMPEGRMGVRMKDGTEYEIGPGDVVTIQPGHDAWVVGDLIVLFVDFGQVGEYAKPK